MKADKAIALPRFKEITRGYDYVFLDGPPRLGDSEKRIVADVHEQIHRHVRLRCLELGMLVRDYILGLANLARQLFDESELLLQLDIVSFERSQLGGLARNEAQQLLDLRLPGERDTAKLLDVALAP